MSRRLGAGESGQAMIEFALVAPILLLLVMGVAELTQAYSDGLTVGAATREGVRVAGALVNGGGALGCSAGQSPNASTVDPQIIASIERVLTGSGTALNLADVQEIRIYKSTAAGGEVAGAVNTFTYSLNAGPVVDGQATDFVVTSTGWPACQRSNATPADSAGVAIRYTYRGRTPIRFLVPFLQNIQIRDNTVMALNATR